MPILYQNTHAVSISSIEQVLSFAGANYEGGTACNSKKVWASLGMG